MIEFDSKIWKSRAHSRAARRGSKRRPATDSQLKRDYFFIDRIAAVVEWCAFKGIRVFFGKKPGGTYDTGSKTIMIVGRAAPEKQLYYLLHECGHHLIGYKEHDERFGMGYPKAGDPDHNDTFRHRFACFEEEIEAWNRGWRLAKRLRLRIKREDFDRIRLICLRSYIQWVSSRTLLLNL